MNFLEIAQLASAAFQLLGEAAHGNFKNNFINQVKDSLLELSKMCQEKHAEQQKQQEAPKDVLPRAAE